MLLENLGFGVYLIPLLPAIFLNHKSLAYIKILSFWAQDIHTALISTHRIFCPKRRTKIHRQIHSSHQGTRKIALKRTNAKSGFGKFTIRPFRPHIWKSEGPFWNLLRDTQGSAAYLKGSERHGYRRSFRLCCNLRPLSKIMGIDSAHRPPRNDRRKRKKPESRHFEIRPRLSQNRKGFPWRAWLGTISQPKLLSLLIMPSSYCSESFEEGIPCDSC